MSDPPREDLRSAALRGVRWVGIGRFLTEAVGFASSVVLARLISPASFGHAAVALIVVSLAVILGPAGSTAALVQRKELLDSHLETSSFLSISAGVVLTLATLGFAYAGAPQVFGDETAHLIGLASVSWVIGSFGAVPQALLQRELRFRAIAVIDSTSALAGAGVAVALGLTGVGASALIVGGIARTLTGTVVAVASARSAFPRPTRTGLSDLSRFAAEVSGSSFVYSMFLNIDYAILGIQLPARLVGLYWRGYQLGVDYQSKISQIMLRVAFPIYSRATGLDDLRRVRRRIVRIHGVVLIPLLSLLIAAAPELVPRLFGSAWRASIEPAQILAVAGMAYSVRTGIGPLMVAVGRPRALLWWNVCELTSYGVLVAILGPHGLIPVSIGVAAFAIASLVVVQVFLLKPFVGLPLRTLLDDVAPGIGVGAGVLGVLSLFRLGTAGNVTGWLLLVTLIILGGIVYLVVLRLFFLGEWRDLESVVRRFRPATESTDESARQPAT